MKLQWTEFLFHFGLAYVLAASKISLPFRALLATWAEFKYMLWPVAKFVLALIECPACFGFWSGLTAGYMTSQSWVLAFKSAFMVCGFNYIAAHFTIEKSA